MGAVIRAVVPTNIALRLQVDFGHDQTALIHEWQIVKEEDRSNALETPSYRVETFQSREAGNPGASVRLWETRKPD